MNDDTQNTLYKAIANQTTTKNGAVAFKSTLSACLDCFYKAPITTNVNELVILFINAYREDAKTATALAFWLRDPRNGAGRRANGRAAFAVLNTIEGSNETSFSNIAKYGRFDDLMHFTRHIDSRNFSVLD